MNVIEHWERKLREKEAELDSFSSKMVKERIRKEIEEIKEIISELRKEQDVER